MNKGLSVVAFDGWDFRLDEDYDEGYEWVMPVHVIGPRRIRLLAVWDMGKRGNGYESARILGSCRASLSRYGEFLKGDADLTVISGDFNNSVYWDTPEKSVEVRRLHGRPGVTRLRQRLPLQAPVWARGGARTDTVVEEERRRGYHIDYTFVRPGDAVEAVAVGSYEDWITYSDHPPMTVNLRL